MPNPPREEKKPSHGPVGAYLPIGQLEGDRCKCGNEWPCPDFREEWCICGYRGRWVIAPGDTHTQGCSDQWRRLGEARQKAADERAEQIAQNVQAIMNDQVSLNAYGMDYYDGRRDAFSEAVRIALGSPR